MELNNKKKVLVIDDNVSLTTVLTDKLNLSGFEAVGAFDGEHGLQKALALHPDAILLDLVMPKMDGLTMLGQLRADAWGKTCKVIVLTLLEENDYIAKAVEYNVLGYIVKTSSSLDDIVSQVQGMLGKTAN